MKLMNILGVLIAVTLLVPAAADAATSKRSSKSSAGQLRKIGDGPLGAFVAAPPQNIHLKVGILDYFKPMIGYERALSEDNSWAAQLGFYGESGTGYSVTTLDIIGSYRWWLGQHAKMQGIYVGPLAGLSMTTVSVNILGFKSSGSASSFVIGAEAGYQWILPMGMLLNAGVNAPFVVGSGTNVGTKTVGNGLRPVIVGSIGWAF